MISVAEIVPSIPRAHSRSVNPSENPRATSRDRIISGTGCQLCAAIAVGRRVIASNYQHVRIKIEQGG